MIILQTQYIQLGKLFLLYKYFFINIFTKLPTYIIFSTNRVLLKKIRMKVY